MERLEAILHVVIVKPLAWVLLWAWWSICWISCRIVQATRWARQRWTARRVRVRHRAA
jgi:hypothetical protein